MFLFKHTYIFCLLAVLLTTPALCQDSTKSMQGKLKKLVDKFNKSSYVVAPIISYQPETSWQFGVGVKYLFRPKNYDSSDTRKSFFAGAIKYTVKRQVLFTPAIVIFTNHENFLLDGNYVYKKFPQNYFGTGYNTRIEDKELVDLQELRLEQILFKKVQDKLFAGGGVRYLNIFDVAQKADGLLIKDKPTGWDGFQSIGLTANLRFDNRDNVLNAFSGSYIDFRAGLMRKRTGIKGNYSLYRLDARKYNKPFEHRNDVLAAQFMYQAAPTGDVPFTELSFLGSDGLMRGYYGRRYIDRYFIGGQVEYRLALPHNFGLVGFAGLGEVYNTSNDIQLSHLKYSIGTGIRYKIIPKENINVRFDIGFGNGSTAFYMSIAEAF